MKLPRDIGPVHFVGIGGIGMSGIAEVMLNLGYVVQGSDQAEGANVKRLREKGVKIAIGHAASNLGDAKVAGRLFGHQTRQSGIGRGARATPAGRAPRRDAGGTDAPEKLRRHCRHSRQDHDHLDGGGFARRRRLRSDRDQWRHHQRLWHQRAARRRRMDGGRGRRIRRHVSQAAGRHRDRDQYRSRASRSLQEFRGGAGGVSRLRGKCAVLRLLRHVHRPSGGADAGRPHRGPARHHLRRESASRRAAARCLACRRHLAVLDRCCATAPDSPCTRSRISRCRCPAGTTRSTPPPRLRSRTSSASTTPASRRRSPISAACGGASRAPAPGTASPSSTITATIRSRSPPCSRRRASRPRAR